VPPPANARRQHQRSNVSKKKSAAQVGKMVDAQAKGKSVKSAKKDAKRSTGGELDSRENKFDMWKAN
jgi:hypothetical protein